VRIRAAWAALALWLASLNGVAARVIDWPAQLGLPIQENVGRHKLNYGVIALTVRRLINDPNPNSWRELPVGAPPERTLVDLLL
jgi:hypothetical protein